MTSGTHRNTPADYAVQGINERLTLAARGRIFVSRSIPARLRWFPNLGWEGRMRLYKANYAPNPRSVRVFLAEKGVSIRRVEVDLARLEHKTPEYSAVKPFQVIPAPDLDDATVIGESIVICRYIEELHPDPNLFGAIGWHHPQGPRYQPRPQPWAINVAPDMVSERDGNGIACTETEAKPTSGATDVRTILRISSPSGQAVRV
ncbi:glutathione S-transferase N-terminal domain-containing protein [Roseiarcus sp.]|uniref:glutathione S-transferase N-terminal domain-containing protein n=1 Tax=Roseiarcus sp. TaxID=1969460 RepID=UPI003F9A0DAD